MKNIILPTATKCVFGDEEVIWKIEATQEQVKAFEKSIKKSQRYWKWCLIKMYIKKYLFFWRLK